MAKKVKNKTVFDEMPIDEWMPYIEKKAKDEDEARELKVKARRSLTVDNMAAYILKNDNTAAAKKAFKDAAVYIAKDGDGNPLTDENNNVIEKKSVINAASYFVDKYIPDLKVGKKEKANAFDVIADW